MGRQGGGPTTPLAKGRRVPEWNLGGLGDWGKGELRWETGGLGTKGTELQTGMGLHTLGLGKGDRGH